MVKKAFIIAECGNNHEGDLTIACNMIQEAKKCGCDAVKFQAGRAEEFARNKEDIPKYRKFELQLKEYVHLHNVGLDIKIPIFFSIWSKEFDILRDYEKYHKIPARQCTKQNIKKWDKTNTFISIPSYMEIEEIKKLGIKKAIPMHCVSQYPANNPCFNRMIELKKIFGKVGFSDHFIDIFKARQAIVLGAEVIEKHFTLNHEMSNFRDHQLSADPFEMKILTKFAKEMSI